MSKYISNCSECDKDHVRYERGTVSLHRSEWRGCPVSAAWWGGSMEGIGSWGHSGGASPGQGSKGQERQVEGREGTARGLEPG